MMPRATLDVTTVRVNIFSRDRETMTKQYGYGWTQKVRELVNEHCIKLRQNQQEKVDD